MRFYNQAHQSGATRTEPDLVSRTALRLTGRHGEAGTRSSSLSRVNGHRFRSSSIQKPRQIPPEGGKLSPPLILSQVKGREGKGIFFKSTGQLKGGCPSESRSNTEIRRSESARLPLTRACALTDPARHARDAGASAMSGTVRGHRIVSWTWRPRRAVTPSRTRGGGA